jgi:hypothetical protein
MANKSHDEESATNSLPAAKSAKLPKAGTTYLFPKTREERRSALTHTQIEEDLAEFERTGGRIEVLGNTHTFKNLHPSSRSATQTPSADDTAETKSDAEASAAGA